MKVASNKPDLDLHNIKNENLPALYVAQMIAAWAAGKHPGIRMSNSLIVRAHFYSTLKTRIFRGAVIQAAARRTRHEQLYFDTMRDLSRYGLEKGLIESPPLDRIRVLLQGDEKLFYYIYRIVKYLIRLVPIGEAQESNKLQASLTKAKFLTYHVKDGEPIVLNRMHTLWKRYWNVSPLIFALGEVGVQPSKFFTHEFASNAAQSRDDITRILQTAIACRKFLTISQEREIIPRDSLAEFNLTQNPRSLFNYLSSVSDAASRVDMSQYQTALDSNELRILSSYTPELARSARPLSI